MVDNHSPKPEQTNGYLLVTRGRYALMELYVEAMDGIDKDMEAIGLAGLSTDQSGQRLQSHPLFPASSVEGTTAFDIRTEDVLAVAVFIQDPIIKGTIEVLTAKILEAILPRFRKLFTHAKKESVVQYPMTISSAFFFSQEQVQITAIATLKKHSDEEVALKLFPLAFEKGVDWVAKNGRQGRYLTFRIIDGIIDGFPTVTDYPLPFLPS